MGKILIGFEKKHCCIQRRINSNIFQKLGPFWEEKSFEIVAFSLSKKKLKLQKEVSLCVSVLYLWP